MSFMSKSIIAALGFTFASPMLTLAADASIGRDEYERKVQTLAPPEKNIGLPGTVTKGEVEFRARGRISEPVWKGKVEFHALGREEPVDTLSLEKVCTWDGTKFAPLQ